MTTRPRLRLGRHLLPGLAAVGLFAVLAVAFVAAPVGGAAGYPDEGALAEANVTAALLAGEGYDATVDGGQTNVTVSTDGGEVTHTLTPEDVAGERQGTITFAVVSVPVDGERVTVERVALVDHGEDGAGPGAQVVAEQREDGAIHAVARRGSITESIGYAMFDLRSVQPLPAEGFLASLLLVGVVLDAALEASVHLARRGDEDEVLTALGADTDPEPEGGER